MRHKLAPQIHIVQSNTDETTIEAGSAGSSFASFTSDHVSAVPVLRGGEEIREHGRLEGAAARQDRAVAAGSICNKNVFHSRRFVPSNFQISNSDPDIQ